MLLDWPLQRSPDDLGYRARYGHAWWDAVYDPSSFRDAVVVMVVVTAGVALAVGYLPGGCARGSG